MSISVELLSCISKETRLKRATQLRRSVDVGCGFRPIGNVNVDTFSRSYYGNRGAPKKIQNLVKADVQHLPFPDKLFLKTYCLNTLEHVADVREAVKELIRITDETVVFTVPHRYWRKRPFRRKLGNFCFGVSHITRLVRSLGYDPHVEKEYSYVCGFVPMPRRIQVTISLKAYKEPFRAEEFI